MSQTLIYTRSWNVVEKAVFRFFASYFILYSSSPFLSFLWDPATILFTRLIHIPLPKYQPSGSGDTLYNYMQVLLLLIIAFVITLVWTLIDRKRMHYSKLMYWVYVFVRYELASFLLLYGFAKIFKTQFPFPSLSRLTEPYGNSSPMGLIWAFMGYSRGFNLFTGLAEALGGFLLFFRRSTLFGALFSMTVLSNIVAINLCYDVPVKLFSIHLLLMAIFITAPHIRRLTLFFFYNKTVPYTGYYPVVNGKLWRVVHAGMKIVFIGAAFWFAIYENGISTDDIGKKTIDQPLYGIYTVEKITKNGTDIPLLMTDTTAWRFFIVTRDGDVIVRKTNDNPIVYMATIDTTNKKINLKQYNDSAGEETYQYKLTDKNHMLIEKTWLGDTTRIYLQKKDINSYLLVNRGFRWVNEYPFNR